jgi:Ca2+-binding RTX toxin-like protein
MSFYQFEWANFIAVDQDPLALTGIADLKIGSFDGETVLYSLSRAGGAMAIYDLDGVASYNQSWATSSSYGNVGVPELAFVRLGNQEKVMAVGYGSTHIYNHRVDSIGQTSWITIKAPDLDMSLVNNLAIVQVNGTELTIGSLRGGGMFEITSSTTKTSVTETIGLPAEFSGQIEDLQSYTIGNRGFIVAAFAQDDKIAVFEVLGSGQLQFQSAAGTHTNLSISYPSELSVFQIEGQTYVVTGSALSGSLTVSKIDANGIIEPLDQMNDDLSTRFSNVTALDTIVIDGRAFIVAGGNDDGLTLLTVLPNGRLHVLATVADSNATGLQNVTTVELLHENGTLRVFAAAEGEAGLTEFTIDMSTIGTAYIASNAGDSLSGTSLDDILQGGDGDDTINGGAGEDILIDGLGVDMLIGGTGSDVFIMSRDEETDTIADFNYLEDRIDLSNYGIHDIKSTLIAPRSYGADIVFDGEVIKVISHSGASLLPDQLRSTFIVPDHVAIDGTAQLSAGPIANTASAPFVNGTETADTVDAGNDANIVLGLGGDDMIYGMDGDDLLVGGAGNDMLYGGNQNDVLFGGNGADWLYGEAGNDFLSGGKFNETFDVPAGQIYRIYRAVFNRDPGMEGHEFWTDRLITKTDSLNSISNFFLSSQEMRTRYADVTNTALVNLLYENVLERTPNEDGLNYWVGQLEAGKSFSSVVIGFSESSEHIQKTYAASVNYSTAAYVGEYVDEIYSIYAGLLGRTPEMPGLTYWMDFMNEGASADSVINIFLATAEFTNRFNVDATADYVSLLYSNVLNREAGTGLAYWSNKIDSGEMSRTDVAKYFVFSDENTQKTLAALPDFIASLGVEDTLDGGTGTDILFGGALSDRFVFAPNSSGTNTVADLEAWDYIDLTAFDFTSDAEALSHFSQTGSGVTFNANASTAIFINTDLDMITADMIEI